jgi:pantoate--beta-alanine ligase
MILAKSFAELRNARAGLPEPVGFVPTMGALHEGHLSLVRKARTECASVAVSIFVNPTQFGPSEDLAKYPHDLPRDLALLQPLNVDLVWAPTPDDMYPPGFQTWVAVEEVTKPLEGSLRPGHFRGVTTVVTKLFNGVQPQRAYFGQKDAQQVVAIRQMTKDLDFPIEIRVCPTVREADGLAMSSRNGYLNPEERRAAVILYKALLAAKRAYEGGERKADQLRQVISTTLGQEPLARPLYTSCANPDTLLELDTIDGLALLSLAVIIGKTRLIDNILLP